MTRLFDGTLWVSYGQAYVESDDVGFGLMEETFRGQSNGLCGAAVDGTLFLVTGLHTGRVSFRAELHDLEPPVDLTYEDIVEVSFRPNSEWVALKKWPGDVVEPLALQATSYRVRYSAANMDLAKDADTLEESLQPLDAYLLQFWPAPPAPDRVLRQTSETAAYWHAEARRHVLV